LPLIGKSLPTENRYKRIKGDSQPHLTGSTKIKLQTKPKKKFVGGGDQGGDALQTSKLCVGGRRKLPAKPKWLIRSHPGGKKSRKHFMNLCGKDFFRGRGGGGPKRSSLGDGTPK